jgi:heme oxygenase (biliverdin-IX-beta and delta-forming)
LPLSGHIHSGMVQSTSRSPGSAACPVPPDARASGRIGKSSALAPPDLTLSAQLRARTANLHRDTERQLGLPHVIRTFDDYKGWLVRFLGLYRPLEQSLASFTDWSSDTILLPSPSHSARLAADLRALGIEAAGIAYAPASLLPPLPTFGHAVGALYVLEGSSLGGVVILRQLEARLGPPIRVATRFFGGRADGTGAAWKRFKADVDSLGRREPDLTDNAVAGAESVFRALLAWFAL